MMRAAGNKLGPYEFVGPRRPSNQAKSCEELKPAVGDFCDAACFECLNRLSICDACRRGLGSGPEETRAVPI